MRKIMLVITLASIISLSLVFATENDATPTTEVVVEESNDKLDNMKENTDDWMFEVPEGDNSGDDVSLDQGIRNLDNKINYWWKAIEYFIKKYSMYLALMISFFSLVLFYIFKAARNKMAQRGAMFMIVLPIISYIIYMYLPAFLSTLR